MCPDESARQLQRFLPARNSFISCDKRLVHAAVNLSFSFPMSSEKKKRKRKGKGDGRGKDLESDLS